MPQARIRALRAADVAEALEMFAQVAAEGIWLGTQAGFDRHMRRQAWLDGLADPAVRSLVVEEVGPTRLVGQGTLRSACTCRVGSSSRVGSGRTTGARPARCGTRS
jgi:hypothetical protein